MYQSRFERFVTLTGNATKSIQRIKLKRMAPFNLTGAHTNCLARLAEADPNGLSQTELVELEMMDASQISRVLQELIGKGYVVLTGREGRYRRRYQLTDEGREVAKQIREVIGEVCTYVTGDIPDADIETFDRVLETICRRLTVAQEIYAERNRLPGLRMDD